MLLLLPCLSVNAQEPLPEVGAAQDTLYRNPGQGKVASALGLGDILVGSAVIPASIAIVPLIYALQGEAVSLLEGLLVTFIMAEYAALGISLGGAVLSLGLPLYIAGTAARRYPYNWRTARYADALKGKMSYTGFYDFGAGFVQGAGPVVDVGLTVEYNRDYHWAFGGGLNLSAQFEPTLLRLPVFADVKYSFIDSMLTPYVGVSAGAEVVKWGFYGSAELGMRIRTSTAGPNSMLSGLQVKYLENKFYLVFKNAFVF